MSRVIVIDDDAELRTELAERLRDAGFEVSEAADGHDDRANRDAGKPGHSAVIRSRAKGVWHD